MRLIGLALAVVEVLLKLIDSLLEFSLSFLEVLFGLVTLLFEEVELAFPEGPVLVVVVDLVLQLNLQVVVLATDAFEFGSDCNLVTFPDLHKLLILFA